MVVRVGGSCAALRFVVVWAKVRKNVLLEMVFSTMCDDASWLGHASAPTLRTLQQLCHC
jgi:hypothetical protein